MLCVRWYLRYSLGDRDLEEIMTECGLSVERDVIGQLQFIQNLFGIAASNWDQLMLPLVVVLLFATEPV